MRSIGRTDIGLVRKVNEDSFLCEKLEGVSKAYLYIVADGMGGHNAGEIASSMAVDLVAAHIKQNCGMLEDGKGAQELIRSAVQKANRIVFEASISQSSYSGMGTTLSMALIIDRILYVAHVGDSRIYLVRKSNIKKLTEDHSLVAELLKTGSIKPEEASNHPQRNVITRALGTESTIEVDVFQWELEWDDYIIICTDGLSNMVSEEEMLSSINNSKDINEACDLLIDRAKEKGGFDNITVIIIQMCKGGE